MRKNNPVTDSLVAQNLNLKGIVLTPIYVARMIGETVHFLGGDQIIDLCSGTGILLEGCKQANPGCEILGVEIEPELYNITPDSIKIHTQNADCFELSIYKDFAPNALVLNPPYTKKTKGMEFVRYGLDLLRKGGVGVVIVPSSVGAGLDINKDILTRHSLLCSIKMPGDLFLPHAAAQTNIYIFEAHKPCRSESHVEFINFSDNGYKRTKRKSGNLQEIDNPKEKYKTISKLATAPVNIILEEMGKVEHADKIPNFVINQISLNGNDWNIESHIIIDARPTYEDFYKTVKDFMLWQLKEIEQGRETVENILRKERAYFKGESILQRAKREQEEQIKLNDTNTPQPDYAFMGAYIHVSATRS